MKKFNLCISLLLILSFLMPLVADAKAGSSYRGGGSFRGSSGGYRGYQQSPSYNYSPRPTPAYQTRSSTAPFFSGLLSGILGAYLYNKMFPADKATADANQNRSAVNQPTAAREGIGFSRILIILLGAYILWRFLRRRRNSDDRSNYINRDDTSASGPMNIKDFINQSRSTPERIASNLSQDDHNAFENLLVQIQNAWSDYNLRELRRLTTPGMYENFAQTIQDNQQQNIKNYITNVRLLNQDLLNTWQEGNSLFARVALTWSAIDYAVNSSLSPQDPGYLVDGNVTEPTTSTEVWIFEKNANQPWLLAAIEQ